MPRWPENYVSKRKCPKCGNKKDFYSKHCAACVEPPPGWATPYASSHGYQLLPGGAYEHRLLAEKALGRPLPPGAEVHHVEGKKNVRGNLVVCQDRAYHFLLHARTRAYRACGNPEYRMCCYCKQWDHASELFRFRPKSSSHFHRTCYRSNYNIKAKERRARAKEKDLQP